ncbi:MAG: SDR family NAD(P)-dependent oxidoreductase [Oscillospiraceae bacterium]|nr:SDR family NAD(P)-dependent oxidoreductase [Oscillospiraceae bacterium]
MKYVYGKNVFLTGGSSGIGLATAELFAANGYTVFAASRNPTAATRTFPGGGEIRPVKLDVRAMKSIGAAAESVLAEADIGIVIHCAGVGIACPGEDFPEDAVTGLIDTNFNGVLRVNSRFLPALRLRKGGICVIVGSVGGVFSIPFQSHYCASKAALISYSKALRMELRDFGVRVSLVSPGDTATDFTTARKYEIDEDSPYYSTCIKSVKKMENDEQNGRPPLSVAQTILRLCTRRNPPAQTVVGFDYKLLVFLRRLMPDRLVEFILRRMYLG